MDETLIKCISGLISLVITALIGLISGQIKNRMSYRYREKERVNVVTILTELETLNFDDHFKDVVKDEYKRIVIKSIKGIDIAAKNYDIILQNRALDKYSNSQINIASRFFKFNKGKLEVEIPVMEKIFSIFYFVFAFLILLFSCWMMFIAVFASLESLKSWVFAGFSLITMLFGFYSLTIFVAPATVAKLIKSDLKQ